MPTRLYLRLIEALVIIVSAAMIFAAWRSNLRDQAQLASDLAVAKQSLAQDGARQRDRDTQLAQTLAALAAQKRAITTPAQILRALPNQIPLPAPITLQTLAPCSSGPVSEPQGSDSAISVRSTNSTNKQSTPISLSAPCSSGPLFGPEGLDSPTSSTLMQGNRPADTTAAIPTADMKPLYDFAIDCHACQAKLTAAQADLTDERAKTATLTRERDEAVRAAKGGSLLRRVAHNAKWLLIGAAAGAIAAKAHP